MLVLMGLYIIYTILNSIKCFNQASLDLASKRKDVDTSSSIETKDRSSQSASVSQDQIAKFFRTEKSQVFFQVVVFLGCIGREG